jgi:hypothetical protein
MITKMAKKHMTRHIRYRLIFLFILVAWMVSSSLAATDTAELTVTVIDTTPPTLISVEASMGTEVVVLFSEPIEQASAETITNYAIDQGISISAATLDTDLKTVYLTVSPLSEEITYTLTANNIKDRATPPNTIAPDTAETFIYSISLMGDWKFDEGSEQQPAIHQEMAMKAQFMGLVGQKVNLERHYSLMELMTMFRFLQVLLWIP